MNPETPERPFEPPLEPSTPEAEKKGHGCFFYGCVTALVVSVLTIVVAVIAGIWGWNRINALAVEYTDTAPTPFAKVELPPEEVKSLEERVKAFKEALDKGEDTEPLVLTSDQLNALIDDQPDLKGRVQASIEGDKIKGKVSLPLDNLGLASLKGRYLNGMASFNVSLDNGVLIVTIAELEVKGKPMPAQFMQSMAGQNLAKDAYKDPKNAEMIRKLDSIVVKDGKIVIKARPKESRGPAAADSNAPAKEMPDDTKALEKPEPADAKTPDDTKALEKPEPADTKAPEKVETDVTPADPTPPKAEVK